MSSSSCWTVSIDSGKSTRMCWTTSPWISLKSCRGTYLRLSPMHTLIYCYSPDMEVKRKALSVSLEMTTSRNVEEVVLFLKKQLQATVDSNAETYDKSIEQEYRQLLIQSIHSCAIKFSEVAANVVHVLMDFLGDNNNPSAVDVIAFVR